jgi:hypothetical protein
VNVRPIAGQRHNPEVALAQMRQTGSVNEPADRNDVSARATTADRLDGLADVAELMDDDDGALRLRRQASALRVAAMGLLDE